MTEQHPITPPIELVQQWFLGAKAMPVDQWVTDVATQAARWGADRELEACCYIAVSDPVCGTKHQRNMLVRHVKEQRRPKPLSLKEKALVRCNDYIDPDGIIRRALEALPDD